MFAIVLFALVFSSLYYLYLVRQSSKPPVVEVECLPPKIQEPQKSIPKDFGKLADKMRQHFS